MDIELKPVDRQVIVITGASSGIGLATAQKAASVGAKLVLAARSAEALETIADELGSDVVAVVCDVSDREQLEHVADVAIRAFGQIDTWVNNAGVSVYGRLDEVSEEDCRQVFETNFWGVYHGSLIALRYLGRKGGVLINIGSEVSDAVIPFQGIYAASKNAVKALTDALRVEVGEIDKAPVSITLIQPTAVDTPYPEHAKNYMNKEPTLPAPMIEPEEVAEAILDAAVKPTREVKVGMMAVSTTMDTGRQQYQESPRDREGALYRPSEATGVVGQTRGTGGGRG